MAEPTSSAAEARAANNPWPGLVIAGAAPAAWAVALYLGCTAPTVQFGRSGFLCAAATDLTVPPPGTSPLYALIGHIWLMLGVGDGPAHSLGILSGILGALAAGATGVAALEILRAARAPNPEADHVPGLRDVTMAAAVASGMVVCADLWDASVMADSRGLSILLAALFVAFSARWRRKRLLSGGAGLVLGLTAGLGLTQHLLFAFIVISGLLPVLLASISARIPHQGAPRIQVGRAWRQMLIGLVAGLLPWLLLIGRETAYPPGLWPTPDGLGMFDYLAAGLLGSAHFDATPMAAPLLARRVMQSLFADTGPLPWVGAAVAAVTMVRLKLHPEVLYREKSLSAALWFGLLVFLVGWIPGWSQGSEMGLHLRIYCSFGLTLVAAAGFGAALEYAENKPGLPLGWSLTAGVIVLVLLSAQAAYPLHDVSQDRAAGEYAESMIDTTPESGTIVLSRNAKKGLLLADEVDIAGPLAYARSCAGAHLGLRMGGPITEDSQGMDWLSPYVEDGRVLAPASWGFSVSPRERGEMSRSDRGEQTSIGTIPYRTACISSLLAGDWESAQAAIETATELAPGVPANQELAAIVALREDDPDEALRIAETNRRSHPVRWQAWEVRGHALRALGRDEDAELSLKIARSLSRSSEPENGIAVLCSPERVP